LAGISSRSPWWPEDIKQAAGDEPLPEDEVMAAVARIARPVVKDAEDVVTEADEPKATKPAASSDARKATLVAAAIVAAMSAIKLFDWYRATN